MKSKKSKQLKPVPPITIGPFSPRVAKILLEADKEYRKKNIKWKTFITQQPPHLVISNFNIF
jgi:hypothetical protein